MTAIGPPFAMSRPRLSQSSAQSARIAMEWPLNPDSAEFVPGGFVGY